MNSHDDQIGPPWSKDSVSVTEVLQLMRDQLGGRSTELQMTLAYLIGDEPAKVRHAVLLTAHDMGRHAGGKCPEQCPRF
jgi:hypothetical protein